MKFSLFAVVTVALAMSEHVAFGGEASAQKAPKATKAPKSSKAPKATKVVKEIKTLRYDQNISTIFGSRVVGSLVLPTKPETDIVGFASSLSVVDSADDEIGTSDFHCSTTKNISDTNYTVICNGAICFDDDGSCIFGTGRNIIDLSTTPGCPSQLAGSITGGTGEYDGISGSFTTTDSDCGTDLTNPIRETTVLTFRK